VLSRGPARSEWLERKHSREKEIGLQTFLGKKAALHKNHNGIGENGVEKRKKKHEKKDGLSTEVVNKLSLGRGVSHCGIAVVLGRGGKRPRESLGFGAGKRW